VFLHTIYLEEDVPTHRYTEDGAFSDLMGDSLRRNAVHTLEELQFYDPTLQRDHGSVCTVVCSQLGKDVLDSALNRFFAD